VVIWVAALIGLAAIVAIFSVKSDTRRAALEVVTGTYSNDRKYSWSTAAGEELIRANSQHYFIAYYIAQCFNGVDLAWNDRSGPPPQISIPLMFGLQPSGEIRWGSNVAAFSRIFTAPENVELRKAYDTISSGYKQSVKLNNYQKSILTLSNAISRSRTQLASSAAESDSARYLLQISIIVIGALTTILVSVSVCPKSS
jgi:hypothetical protein